MNEICIEHCAVNRDCSAFEPKPNLKLADMPRFPLGSSANMTKEEKFTSVTVYLAKVVEHLQGNDDEYKQLDYRRYPGVASSEKLKALAEVADSLNSPQNNLAGSYAGKEAKSSTAISNAKAGSENVTGKEIE